MRATPAHPEQHEATTPSATLRHDLANLAVTVRRFLELTQSTQQTYFVKRGFFSPVDELAFEQDWGKLFQAAVHLQQKLALGLHHLERLGHDPALTQHVALFREQVKNYQLWFKKVRLTRQFAMIGNLLQSILPHEHSTMTAHAKLCCTEQVLMAILTHLAQEELLNVQMMRKNRTE
jgi:hypothetical protein